MILAEKQQRMVCHYVRNTNFFSLHIHNLNSFFDIRVNLKSTMLSASTTEQSFSYRGHSGTVPAAGGQCLCFLERKFTFRWWLPLWTGYVVVLSPFFFFNCILFFESFLYSSVIHSHYIFFFLNCHFYLYIFLPSFFICLGLCLQVQRLVSAQLASTPGVPLAWRGCSPPSGSCEVTATQQPTSLSMVQRSIFMKTCLLGSLLLDRGTATRPDTLTTITWPLIGQKYLHQQVPLGSRYRWWLMSLFIKTSEGWTSDQLNSIPHFYCHLAFRPILGTPVNT